MIFYIDRSHAASFVGGVIQSELLAAVFPNTPSMTHVELVNSQPAALFQIN
jgi:hypothetical protein